LLGAIESRRRQLFVEAARTVSVADDGRAGKTGADRAGVAPLSARAACRLSARGRYEADHAAPASETPLSLRAAVAFVSDGEEVPVWVGLMGLLEEYIATWDPPDAKGMGKHFKIHARHGMRCTAPCCTGKRNLEGHHINHLSQGGSDQPDNLTSACRFHHQRGEHGGLARCTGKAPLGVLWRLGREDVGNWFRNERRVPAPAAASMPVELAS